MSKYYVYYLIDPETQQPFYVGKGHKNRYLSHEKEANLPVLKQKNPLKCAFIKEIWKRGQSVQYKFEYCVNENQAYDLEIKTIKQLGRINNKSGVLTNLREGGTGSPNGGKQQIKCIPVTQYTLNGEFIQTFFSIADAEYYSKTAADSIKKCCEGTFRQANNFLWTYLGDVVPTPYTKSSSPKQKRVAMYSLDGRFLASFKSLTEANKKTGIDKTSISRAARASTTVRASDYLFIFIDSLDSIPPTVSQYKRPSHPNSKMVFQFDVNGVYIRNFSSIIEAAKYVNLSPTAIGTACKGKIKQKAGGFFWSHKSVLELEKINHEPKKPKLQIVQCDSNFNEIRTFDSLTHVKKELNIDPSTILKFLKGQLTHAGGFKWKKLSSR